MHNFNIIILNFPRYFEGCPLVIGLTLILITDYIPDMDLESGIFLLYILCVEINKKPFNINNLFKKCNVKI